MSRGLDIFATFCAMFVAILLVGKVGSFVVRRVRKKRRSKGGNGGSAYVGGSGIEIGGRGGSGDIPGEDGKAFVAGKKP